MTTQEMMKATSSLGGWVNVAPLGDAPDWVEAWPPGTIDVNRRTLFGYDEAEFLAKQYK